MLRVREFTMAEIEHFCDPQIKDHPKFDIVENIKMQLYSACNQMDGKSYVSITIGEAVKTVRFFYLYILRKLYFIYKFK